MGSPGGGLGAAWAQARSITVAAGDTLEQLALQQGVSVEALMALNGIRDPRSLQIGQRLLLPNRTSPAYPAAAPARTSGGTPGNPAASQTRQASEPQGPVEPPVDGTGLAASAALLLSPAERRDRAELALREQSGQARWKWFNRTAVDWAGWKLTTSGARFTLVKASDADLGVSRGGASAVAVQCETLRQTWRVNGQWLPWGAAAPGSVGQRIVLDLCSNTLNDPAVPLPPAPPALPGAATPSP
jgi:murein DD-endopeptidase MepM/ murein hydrolase activator NlpD